jgi:acetolactate synthase-1/2/3 large subunit
VSNAEQPASRTGGRILVDELAVHGVEHAFCVPGESYLSVLDALYDSPISLTVCRQEGGAAMMAEAYGKLTGRPGICMVTRGPGATNACPGLHIARQDSTPMILLIGQVERSMRGREAFQEIDYRAFLGPLTKWVEEIDDPSRIPEFLSRAFHAATSGRPGPVALALPEDMLLQRASVPAGKRYQLIDSAPAVEDFARFQELLARAARPLVVLGGSRWDQESVDRIGRFAEAFSLPVAVSFRRQGLFPSTHSHFIGDLGVGANPRLLEYVGECDLILLLGGRLSELPSQAYTLLSIPCPAQTLVHVHPGSEELGKTYRPEIAFNLSPRAFSCTLSALPTAPQSARMQRVAAGRRLYEDWTRQPAEVSGDFNFGEALCALREELPDDAIICNGAGNYAIWVHRYLDYRQFGTQLAPTAGSMGYGVPAAVAAKRLHPGRTVVAFAGDGCFLMNGQEFATAIRYELPIIVVVIDNAMFGTIRMHQEIHYPGRVIGTALSSPDFAAYARAFGGHGERVTATSEFAPAFRAAAASGKPSIIHCITDPDAITPTRSLSRIRGDAIETARVRR